MRRKYAFFCPQGVLLLRDNLYIHRQGSTPENGGQVIYAIEIAKAMAKQGHAVDIYARNYGTPDYPSPTDTIIEQMEGNPDFRILHVPTSAPPSVEKEHFYSYYNEYMTRAAENIKAADYDFLIGHYADGMFMATAMEEYLFQKHGVRRTLMGVTHSLAEEKAETLFNSIKNDPAYGGHDAQDTVSLSGAFEQQVKAYNIRPRFVCEQASFDRMDAIATVSQKHMAFLHNVYLYPEDQMQIIGGGVNREVFYPMNYSAEEKSAARRNLIDRHIDKIGEDRRDLLQDSKVVLGFGRLVLIKGVVEAVQSVATLLESHPDAAYVYIGGLIPPQLEEEIKVYNESVQYAQAGNYLERVFFLGRQDQKTINEWLNVSDVYLHAAHLEPYGLAPMEAAATNIPVVMSMHAGVGAVLRNNEQALHTDTHSPEDIAKQVGRILANPDLASRLTEKAKAALEASGGWDEKAMELATFSEEARRRYLPQRPDRKISNTVPDKNKAQAMDLIGRFPSTVVPENMRDRYIEMSHIVKELLLNARTVDYGLLKDRVLQNGNGHPQPKIDPA